MVVKGVGRVLGVDGIGKKGVNCQAWFALYVTKQLDDFSYVIQPLGLIYPILFLGDQPLCS